MNWKKRLNDGLKFLLILSFLVPLLAGCVPGEPLGIAERYPLESVGGSGGAASYVYRASDRSVPEVAQELIASREPDQQSAEDPERMFLVYPDAIVHLQRDPERPQDTLIEISSREYVRENYDPGFLEGYLLGSLIGDLFGGGRYAGGDYRGYGSKDTYQPKQTYRTPTADDKKQAPPVTVHRTGSIFRRSADADASVSSDDKATGSKPGVTGRIVREGGTDGGSAGGSIGKSKSVFTKSKPSKAPKIKVGKGRISRRR